MIHLPFLRQSFSRRTLTLLSILLLSFSLWSCSGDQDTAQADTEIDSELEAQVLEILRKNPEVIIESVQQYQQAQQQQQQQEQQQAAAEFQQQVLTDPKAVIGNAPVKGSDAYKVVLIEFSDFECPFCARAHETVNQFIDKHGDTVTLAYKHLPLQQIHDQAIPAAEASWAAQQQGKFWEYHDKLFQNQDQLGDRLYEDIAKELKLDLEKFKADIEKAEPAIQEDLALAQKLRLSGTPFFIFASTETGKFETFSGALPLGELEAKLQAITTP